MRKLLRIAAMSLAVSCACNVTANAATEARGIGVPVATFGVCLPRRLSLRRRHCADRFHPRLLATVLGRWHARGLGWFVDAVSVGSVHRIDPDRGTVTTVSAMNNANTVSFDPAGALWAGWKDTPLASVPTSPLAACMTHVVSGDDVVATMVAFTPANGAFYTTGGELESGNFGRINMATFTTQRLLAAANATGAVFDPFSGHLIVAGLGRAKQIAPGNPTVVLSSRDDSASGEIYLVLQADGRGHLFGTRFGPQARLVLIDYSATGLVGAASSVIVSVPIPGITNLLGEAGVDANSIFKDGFEAPPP